MDKLFNGWFCTIMFWFLFSSFFIVVYMGSHGFVHAYKALIIIVPGLVVFTRIMYMDWRNSL